MLLEQMFPSLLSATKEFHDKTGGSWEVIVVDDGSVDDTIPWIETIPEKRVKLITRRRKSGFALACNLGFTACRYETIILLNNDVTVDQGFIVALLPHFQDSRVFGVSFKSMLRDRSSFHSGGKIGEFRLGFWKAFRNYDIADGHAADAEGSACYSFNVYGGFCDESPEASGVGRIRTAHVALLLGRRRVVLSCLEARLGYSLRAQKHCLSRCDE